jgi:uncharacterized membrane protein
MKNKIQLFAWLLVISGCIVSGYFLATTLFDGYWIWSKNKIDFSTTGQFGDFIGGIVGTIFALAGTLFIFLTLYEQVRQNKRGAFESSFFEMLHLHRENVNEMKYTKYDPNTSEMRTAVNRKVFRLIFKEFTDCYEEIKRFSNLELTGNYVKQEYKEYLEKVFAGKTIDFAELILIDIAYHIIFLGVGEGGETVLRRRFRKRYTDLYIDKLLQFIQLKPKRENTQRWEIWQTFYELSDSQLKKVYLEFCDYKTGAAEMASLTENARMLVCDKAFAKYYNGHQHRLDHYFRHLFQLYKYISFHNDISDSEKYFYGETLTAQLSTYEQGLLFVNSVSSTGMKWELNPNIDFKTADREAIKKSKLITRFNLLKYLPDTYLGKLNYKAYYPDVKYETDDFIQY